MSDPQGAPSGLDYQNVYNRRSENEACLSYPHVFIILIPGAMATEQLP